MSESKHVRILNYQQIYAPVAQAVLLFFFFLSTCYKMAINHNQEREQSSVIVSRHQRADHSKHHYDTCPICYTRPGMPLVPPLNFAMIASGVYRSGHPNKQNFAFLRKLGLKTIL